MRDEGLCSPIVVQVPERVLGTRTRVSVDDRVDVHGDYVGVDLGQSRDPP